MVERVKEERVNEEPKRQIEVEGRENKGTESLERSGGGEVEGDEGVSKGKVATVVNWKLSGNFCPRCHCYLLDGFKLSHLASTSEVLYQTKKNSDVPILSSANSKIVSHVCTYSMLVEGWHQGKGLCQWLVGKGGSSLTAWDWRRGKFAHLHQRSPSQVRFFIFEGPHISLLYIEQYFIDTVYFSPLQVNNKPCEGVMSVQLVLVLLYVILYGCCWYWYCRCCC